MDLGMYLQSVMLLCEGHGLATCAQGYWTFFHETVRQTTGAPDDLMLACGIAIGFEDQDAPINRVCVLGQVLKILRPLLTDETRPAVSMTSSRAIEKIGLSIIDQ